MKTQGSREVTLSLVQISWRQGYRIVKHFYYPICVLKYRVLIKGFGKKLETAVRKLDSDKKVFETYVISGPLFYFDEEVEMMGDSKEGIDVTLPIPHAFFKSVLTERNTGTINMWSFIIPNKKSTKRLDDFLVETSKVEKISGLLLWETLLGTKIMNKKNKKRKMWKL